MDTYRDDDYREEKVFYCECADCGWESEFFAYRDDMSFVECPDCKSENLRDEETYA